MSVNLNIDLALTGTPILKVWLEIKKDASLFRYYLILPNIFQKYLRIVFHCRFQDFLSSEILAASG